uniref:Large ribosomal subunit protein uL23c n=1 Tax=Vicia cracca TaxID=3905 RepID=A0A7T4XB40_VICCR|nr:ribosomal protein L23 [Vicia cracca]QQD90320.1 ribosomal protein L23 [Vicia cracca]
MNGIKNPVFTKKGNSVLAKKKYTIKYTIEAELGSTKTEIKNRVELIYRVKVIAINSHRLQKKGRRMRPFMGHTMHYKLMIITVQPGYSIPLF